MSANHWPYLLAGIVLCFGGWLLYWVAMNLTGALIGGCIGAAVGWALAASAYPSAMIWIVPIVALIGFVLGIFLIRGFHRFLFFLIGSTLGMAVGHASFAWGSDRAAWIMQAPQLWQVVFVLVGSALGGLIMVWGSRWIVALTTSVVGAILVVTSFDDPLFLLGAIPLALASFFAQVGLLRRLMPVRLVESLEDDEEDDR